MSLDSSDRIAAWRELGRRDPAASAAELRRRIATRHNTRQGRAIWAEVADAALLTAAIEDTRAGDAQDSPLAGVPFAVKDLFDVAGWPTRAGSRFLQEERPVPSKDSALVAALRGAGAVPAGKTHLHEFAFGITGENPHYGNCEHPAFSDRTTGGSSSGSAAAVAAGVVPFALGTDTGGSVRVPAAFCGLYGMRLSPEHPWIRDAFPLSPTCDTPGWFTRDAADMRILHSVLIGGTRNTPRPPRGCYLAHGELDADTADACRAAAERLGAARDADTEARLRDTFTDALESYLVITGSEAAEIHAPWLERRRQDYSPIVRERLERGRTRTIDERLRAEVRRRFIGDTLMAYFLTYDYLLLPAVPCPALTHAQCDPAHRTRLLELNAPASLAGLPVLTIPVALRDGLTAGLQCLVPEAGSPAIDWILRHEATTCG